MSNLEAFLHPVQAQETKKIIISNRFQQDGQPVPFVIRALSEEESRKIRESCTRKTRNRAGGVSSEFNADAFSVKMLIAGTVTPDFNSAELCSAYGTMDPMEVPGRMLLAGEYGRLSDAIAELSGFDDNIEGQAKN
ncbi:phage tail assembly chaperone [Oscillibacter sp.]|uniref:phage tail assembly chaperone n=1 Tax=Oscillibacter sp. TaxID=1945593 RepID=UPI0028A1D51F|nr:phage portal protein [Oscillibacter sp.]